MSQWKRISRIREPIDEAIKANELESVWNSVNNGSVYAAYALEKHYLKVVFAKCISDYNIVLMDVYIHDIKKRADAGSKFAEYLVASIQYDMYSKDNRDKEKSKMAVEAILELADRGNLSAITLKGLWGSRGHNNATVNKKEAIELLEKAAKAEHPNALAWLGSYYRTGKKGVAKNREKAEYLLELASDYGHPYGEEQYFALDAVCFITTAVCKSFKLPDDCYELVSFRKFRDEWLKHQEDGLNLINEYYHVAPSIVKNIDLLREKEDIYIKIWEKYLKKCLSAIETKQYEYCKKVYCEMVYDLKDRYYE